MATTLYTQALLVLAREQSLLDDDEIADYLGKPRSAEHGTNDAFEIIDVVNNAARAMAERVKQQLRSRRTVKS